MIATSTSIMCFPLGANRQAGACRPGTLRSLLCPRFELFEAADVLTVDEHLRHGLRARYCADDLAACGMGQRDLGVVVSPLSEQRLGACTILAAFPREDRHLIGLL